MKCHLSQNWIKWTSSFTPQIQETVKVADMKPRIWSEHDDDASDVEISEQVNNHFK